jgi:hypothetical protein
MKQCDLVLEGCPNKCGVTLERRKIQNHLDNDCVNKRRPTNDLQLQIYPQQATSPQAVKNLQQYSDPTAMMEQHQVAM